MNDCERRAATPGRRHRLTHPPCATSSADPDHAWAAGRHGDRRCAHDGFQWAQSLLHCTQIVRIPTRPV